MTRSTDKERDADRDSGSDETAPSPNASGVRVAAWGLVLFAGCRAIEIVLEAQSMAGSVGQAVLVEWGASRVNVGWSPQGEPITTGVIARRIGIGAAIGIALAATLFVVLYASRGVSVQSVAQIEISVIVLGLLSAGLTAWRDEMLLHGVTLRALEIGASTVSPIGRVLACAITSGAAALGRSDATSRTVFSAALIGAVFGALWVSGRGAWKPWAASTAFRFAIGTLLSGGIVHSRLEANAWTGGSAGMLGGTAAVVALLPLFVLALVWTARRISPTAPSTIR